MIQLKLLGPFAAASAEGRALAVAGQRPQALLAYLAMPAGRVRPRAELAALLWGQGNDERARHSLSQALTRLRGWLAEGGADPLVASRDEVMLDAGAVQVDADEIAHLAREGTPAALARAAALWRGDFLEGIDLKAEPFEDWLLARRHELRETAIGVFERLARLDDPEQAIAAARRLLALAPLDESAHRRLIGLHLAAGRADLALLQYERCRDLLRRELGTAPDPATLQLQREALRLARRPAPAAIAPAPAAAADAELAAAWAGAAPPVPDRPSIAVLPFENRSAEADQDFVSDGITEEIITELSRFRSLLVIARNSSFAYQGRAFELRQVGEALGVRYLLRGSVRRGGGRLRVGAQLLEAATGRELWAEKYDRPAEDLFSVQDEVAATIVATLVGRVEGAELQRVRRKPPGSLAAYELVLRGRHLMHRHRREDEIEARRLLEAAVSLDPDSAFARAQLALSHLHEFFWDDSRASLDRAAAIAAEALWLDEGEAWGHMVLSLTSLNRRQFELALHHCERAVALNPSDPDLAAKMGLVLTDLGRPEEAIPLIRRAMRLNPIEADSYCDYLGLALFAARRYAEAIQAFQVEREPKFYDHVWQAACHAHLGDLEQARRHGARALELAPEFTVERFARMEPIRDPADLEHWTSGLRLAGLP
jgi:TolB-like protein/DNA-binding SARP family transcriptional activator/Tfp pilus assembly protein PilF